MWGITWMAMVSSQGWPREGARGAQRTDRGVQRGAYRGGGAGDMGFLGAHWPLTEFCYSGDGFGVDARGTPHAWCAMRTLGSVYIV